MKGPTPWQKRSKWRDIGRRIADACAARRVGHSELAERMDVSPALISKWVGGHGCPTEAFAEQLYHQLTITREYLVNGEGKVAAEIAELLARDTASIRKAEAEYRRRQAASDRDRVAREKYEERRQILDKQKRFGRAVEERLAERAVANSMRCVKCGAKACVPPAMRLCMPCSIGLAEVE